MRLKWLPSNAPWVLVLIAILYLTLAPQPLGDEELQLFPGADKVVHFIMFGALTGSFIYDRWRFDRQLTLHAALVVALCSAVTGGIVEWLQAAMNLGREGNDMLDALANLLGAFAAVPICSALNWLHTGSTSQ